MKKFALVLGGGGGKGFAHIGVLKELEKRNLKPDLIVGTSVGALIGALYANGHSSDEIYELSKKHIEKNLVSLIDINKPSFSLIKGKKLEDLFFNVIGNTSIKNLKIKYIAVATNAKSGEKYEFENGKVLSAIRASISIPGVFEPLHYKNMDLIDGGVVDPVAISSAIQRGYKNIIAVSLHGKNTFMKKRTAFQSLYATLKIFQKKIFDEELKKAPKGVNIINITPDVSDYFMLDFRKIESKIKKGQIAFKRKLKDIRKMLALK